MQLEIRNFFSRNLMKLLKIDDLQYFEVVGGLVWWGRFTHQALIIFIVILNAKILLLLLLCINCY